MSGQLQFMRSYGVHTHGNVFKSWLTINFLKQCLLSQEQFLISSSKEIVISGGFQFLKNPLYIKLFLIYVFVTHVKSSLDTAY